MISTLPLTGAHLRTYQTIFSASDFAQSGLAGSARVVPPRRRDQRGAQRQHEGNAQRPDYFEPVATALAGSDQILIFGTGTGTSSEMDQFTAWLGIHYAELGRRIVGIL